MKHYLYFKFGRVYFEKVYELYSDEVTAKNFKVALEKQYKTTLVMCEVV